MKQPKYKYTTYVEWGYSRHEDGKHYPYDECVITKVSSNDPSLQFDGDNYVSHGGSEGMDFTAHNTLKEAIISSHYDIGAIKFVNITAREVTTVLKDILKSGGTRYDKDSSVSVAIVPIITPTFEEETIMKEPQVQ